METKSESLSANTYAGVYLTNETNSGVQFSFDTQCIDGLSKVTVQANSSNQQTMQTDDNIRCWTTQSGGKMICGNYSFNFQLGTGAYNTSISSMNSPSKFYGFLAANQYTSDNSFDFFVYSGPAIIDSLINSVLNANISAITAALTNNQLTFGNLSLSLTNCSGLNTIQVVYAALMQRGSGSYQLTLVLNSSSIDLEGQAAYGTILPAANAYLKTTNLSILVDIIVNVNLSGSGVEIDTVNVSRLKFSLDDLSISGPIFNINLILKAIMAAATSNMRVIEGILNDEYNEEIISAINKDINNHLPKTF